MRDAKYIKTGVMKARLTKSAKNIEKLAADSKANVQISKNLQALLGVLADSKDAAFQLNIDGSAVTRMITKREENRKAMLPKGT